jgi:hypothetical protein
MNNNLVKRISKKKKSFKKRYSRTMRNIGGKSSNKSKQEKKLVYILYVIMPENKKSDNMLDFFCMSTDLTNLHSASNDIAENTSSKTLSREEMRNIINDSIYIDTIVMNTPNPKHNLEKWTPDGIYGPTIGTSGKQFYYTRQTSDKRGLIKNVYDIEDPAKTKIEEEQFNPSNIIWNENYVPNKNKRQIEQILEFFVDS